MVPFQIYLSRTTKMDDGSEVLFFSKCAPVLAKGVVGQFFDSRVKRVFGHRTVFDL